VTFEREGDASERAIVTVMADDLYPNREWVRAREGHREYRMASEI